MPTTRKPRTARKAEPLPDTLDGIEIAMGAAADDPPDSPSRRLLTAQEQLIRSQIGLADNERFRNRIKAVRDMALTAGVIALLGFGGWTVWRAARADEMVLEPWTAPPAFAEAGQGGEVLAAQLGDRIRTMQIKAETEATGVAKETGGQSTDLELQIPETGVSIDDLERWLRRRLGHQTVVSGAVIRLSDGRLSVTVRTGAGEASTFDGAPADLPALLDKAAEATLRQSDPLRYAGYLLSAARPDEAAKVVVPLTYTGSDRERANALTNLVNIRMQQGRAAEAAAALATARAAVKLDPHNIAALGYLASMEASTGHEEGATSAMRASISASRDRKVLLAVPPYMRAQNAEIWPAMLASLTGDSSGSLDHWRRLADIERTWGQEERAQEFVFSAAGNAVLGHDRGTAATLRSAARLSPDSFQRLLLDLVAAQEAGDRREALRLAHALAARQSSGNGISPFSWMIETAPYVAVAMAEGGDLAAARAVIAPTPLDCDACVRARGGVATAERRWSEADHWFTIATANAPSIPTGWSAWGASKSARGDLGAAITLFRKAQKAGPQWADPLKLEGDVLMRQGKPAAAMRRYREAAERAPRWVALQIAWADALEKMGKVEDAEAKRRAAMTLRPWPGETAQLNRRH